jgi:hypothetical protein
MAWRWMSFCDPARPKGSKFLGALLIEAADSDDALMRSHLLGLNPGGEVVSFEVPQEYVARIEPAMTYRLLSRAECETFERKYAGQPAVSGRG